MSGHACLFFFLCLIAEVILFSVCDNGMLHGMSDGCITQGSFIDCTGLPELRLKVCMALRCWTFTTNYFCYIILTFKWAWWQSSLVTQYFTSLCPTTPLWISQSSNTEKTFIPPRMMKIEHTTGFVGWAAQWQDPEIPIPRQISLGMPESLQLPRAESQPQTPRTWQLLLYSALFQIFIRHPETSLKASSEFTTSGFLILYFPPKKHSLCILWIGKHFYGIFFNPFILQTKPYPCPFHISVNSLWSILKQSLIK